MDLNLEKVCSICSVSKPLSSYHKKTGGRLHSSCKSCKAEWYKTYSGLNKNKLKDSRIKYYWDNREKICEKIKVYRSQNRELIKIRNKVYRETYPHKATEQNVRQKKTRKHSVPKWLTKEQKKEIQNYYWLSKDLQLTTGEQYHVDHIIPIKGKDVCGLHVPWNLQVLPSDINFIKRNKWNPDYE